MTPEQLASLPLNVILLIALAAMARAYVTVQNARVEDLKQLYQESLGDLRLRVHLLEDRAGMPHPMPSNSSLKADLPKFQAKDAKLD